MCFRDFVIQNFPFLEDDFDALTDYKLFCKMVEYMRKALEDVDSFQTQLTAFNQELDYYENYFNNLDLQEEVDHKLDEMAESGELTDIIAQYLGLAGMITFDTVADMKLAENLVNGSKCATLGYHSVNDSGNSLYKVRTVTNDDTIDEKTIIALYNNTLVAELIIEDNMCPEQFGAYGDGTHDDYSSIMTLLNKTNSCYLNDKTYLISDSLNLNSNNKIIGNKESTIYKTTNNSIIVTTNKNNIILKDFSIVGSTSSENQNAISINTSSNILVDNINISNVSNDGVYINTSNYINVSNINTSNTLKAGYLAYQGNYCTFKDSYINGENCTFKYNCQFKSCTNSTMDNITIVNGTEISCYVSQEDVVDNPDAIRPINNTINNIKCIDHGKTWVLPGSGTFCAVFIDGDYTTVNNININKSYTGGFETKASYSNFNNICVNDYAKNNGSHIGVIFRDGTSNNISNINVKTGNGQIGYRSNITYSNITNICVEDCGSSSSSKTQMNIADKYCFYDNVKIIARTVNVRGLSFNYSSNNAEYDVINNFSAIKTDVSYNENDISGTIPTTISIDVKNPVKANIRGSNVTKAFNYTNNVFTIYGINSQSDLGSITAVAGDTRVFSATGIAATNYERTIYNGIAWVNVNQIIS